MGKLMSLCSEGFSCKATIDEEEFKGIRHIATAANVVLPVVVSPPGMHQGFMNEVCDPC